MLSIRVLAALAIVLCVSTAPADEATSDPRFCGPPERTATGEIKRDWRVLRDFMRLYPRPKDGRRWYIDHPLPRSCGGCDSIINLQWLPEDQWREKSKWERIVYGGRGISKGCP